MIANAMVDIWISEGVKPVLKYYEDDLNILRYPTPDKGCPGCCERGGVGRFF